MNTTSAVLFAVLSAALTCPAQKQVSGGKLRADQACYDVLDYDLTLTIDPDKRTIQGALVMTAEITVATKAIALDLDGRLAVSKISVDGTQTAFNHVDGRIAIPFAQEISTGTEIKVRVDYGGVPRVAPRPPWDGGFTWSKTPKGKKHWIATSCQMNGADLWWPCKDHPSDKPNGMTLHITVPKNLYVAANGRLVGKDTTKGKWTYHWRVSTPISNYCIALNIAPYKVLKKTYKSVSGDKIETFFFALPESLKKAKKAFPHFLDHLRHLEETCGPYPFRADKYAIVETPHLGMEHQTIIAYGNKYRLGRDGYDWLHHHEMAHEWWANLVTCRDWKDMWIHEGICTYMQALYKERLNGQKGYLAEMYKNRGGIGNKKAVAPRQVQDTAQIYAGHDVYKKGSWIMHSMRWVMGDKKFFIALRRMAYPDPKMEKARDGSCARLTDTEEIRAIAEKHYGGDLEWFFEVYLRQPALPELISRHNGNKLELEWKVPNDLPFPMPVPVRVKGKTVRVAMPGGKGELKVSAKAKVEVDPQRLILRK